MSRVYQINDLVNMNQIEIMGLPKGKIKIVFGDGELETTSRRTILSWFFWRLLRAFPVDEPIPMEMHIGNAKLTKGAELKLCERVIKFTHRNSIYYREELAMLARGEEPEERLIWRIAEASYQAINEIHNFTVAGISNYATTSDMEDLLDICGSPLVIETKAKLESGVLDFPEANKIVSDYITSDAKELRYNGIAMMARASLLSSKQLYQMVLARGHMEAVNGEVFPRPNFNSFTDGNNNLYYSMAESQSASKALYMNDGPLKQSEYLNRRLQLLVSIVRSVNGYDCGSRHSMEWLVDPDDHKALEGRFHFVDLEGEPYQPKPGEPYDIYDHTRPRGMDVSRGLGGSADPICRLVPYDKDPKWEGKVIYLRSVTECINHDPSTVCETCMGHVSKSFQPTTNIGHFLAIGPISQLSQLILSTKHVDTSTGSDYLFLAGDSKGWLKLNTDNPSNVELRRPTGNYRIRVARKELYGLNTIMHTNTPENLMPQRLSCITQIQIGELDGQGKIKRDYTTVDCMVGGVGSALSKAVVHAIKSNGIREVDDLVEIDLLNFPKGAVLFTTPSRTEDMLTYQSRVRRFLFGSIKKKDAKGECIGDFDATGPAVAALYRLLKEKINNLSLLQVEIFVKSCMTVDGKRGNFNLPIGGQSFVLMPVHQILTGRCITAALAYQNQKKMTMSTSTYINHNRPDHVLDPLY